MLVTQDLDKIFIDSVPSKLHYNICLTWSKLLSQLYIEGNSKRASLQLKEYETRQTSPRSLCTTIVCLLLTKQVPVAYSYPLGIQMVTKPKRALSTPNGNLNGAWKAWQKNMMKKHRNENVVILTKFSTLTLLELIKMTISNGANVENFINMTFSGI